MAAMNSSYSVGHDTKRLLILLIVTVCLCVGFSTTLAQSDSATATPIATDSPTTVGIVALTPTVLATVSGIARAYVSECRFENRVKNYDKAIANCTAAIELSPKFELAFANRAEAYNSKGEYDLAIADSNYAITLNPKDATPYVNREW